MREVADWLTSLGLAKYLEAFTAHEIDFDALCELTEEDLREIGMPVGPRRKLFASLARMRAANVEVDSALPIAAPDPTPAATASPSAAVALKAPSEAERRQLTVVFIDLVGSTALARERRHEMQGETSAAHRVPQSSPSVRADVSREFRNAADRAAPGRTQGDALGRRWNAW